MDNIKILRKLAGLKDSVQLNESSTEYDIKKQTNTFGQYKGEPFETDYADNPIVQTKLSKEEGATSSFVNAKSTDDVDYDFEQEEDNSDLDGEPNLDVKDEEVKSNEEKTTKTETESESEEESKEDKVKNFVKEHVELGKDFSENYLKALYAINTLSEQIVVEFDTNLTTEEEGALAMQLAEEINESIPEHTGNLYRSKKNGLLYKLEKVSPRSHTGSWYEAKPYKHNTPANARKKHVNLKDFEKITESKNLTEKAPPDKEIESWIKNNKKNYASKYGKDSDRVLYSHAWNMYNKKKK